MIFHCSSGFPSCKNHKWLDTLLLSFNPPYMNTPVYYLVVSYLQFVIDKSEVLICCLLRKLKAVWKASPSN